MNSAPTTALFCFALLCALAISCWGPAGASASTTAFTCAAAEAEAQFSDAHCLTAGSGKGFKHVAITEKTGITATNTKTASSTTVSQPSKLKGALAGVETEIECTAVTGTGTLENSLNGEEMVAGFSGTLEYSSCAVVKPIGKECLVKNGEINTNSVSATSKGQKGSLKLTPTSGTTFASVTIEKCSFGALNNTFPITGSLIVAPSGPTLATTHAEITTQNTFKFGGNKAGLEGAITLKGPSGAGLAFT